jgi:uncharacterized membrane protein YhaH (DUF805 family)
MFSLALGISGRIDRKTWWTATTVLFVVVCVAVVVVTLVARALPGKPSEGLGVSHLPTLVFVIFVFACYPAFTINVKRAHDRNKSAWYVAGISLVVGLLVTLQAIALAGPHNFGLGHLLGVWLITWLMWTIELGLLPGTDGTNRFGNPNERDSSDNRRVVAPPVNRTFGEPGKRVFGQASGPRPSTRSPFGK